MHDFVSNARTATAAARAWAGLLVVGVVLSLPGCIDVRDFQGTWVGPRVGESAVLRQGITADASARLVIERADRSSLAARLTVAGLFDDAPVSPIPGAEADILATLTMDNAPARVYLAFVASQDGGGDALCVLSLNDPERVELRIMRGGQAPLYGIFVLKTDDGGMGSS